MERYPYFIYPWLNELERCSDPERERALKLRIAANVGDTDALAAILGPQAGDIIPAEIAAEQSSRAVEESIDSFIAKFSRPGENLADDNLLPPVQETDIQEPALPREQSESPKAAAKVRKTAAAAKPVARTASKAATKAAPKTAPKNAGVAGAKPVQKTIAKPAAKAEVKTGLDDPAAIMAEVKLLVKKREYERALDIMNTFYLNNPKKSIYFADQIRFIKKLMLADTQK